MMAAPVNGEAPYDTETVCTKCSDAKVSVVIRGFESFEEFLAPQGVTAGR